MDLGRTWINTRGNVVVAAPYPVNSDMDMVKMALRGLEKIFKEGYQYKKAGGRGFEYYAGQPKATEHL